MGVQYPTRLRGRGILRCTCGCDLSNLDSVVSKSFRGVHGKAYLLDHVVNINLSKVRDEILSTGNHRITDIQCIGCSKVKGWKYEHADEASQKYKEGRYILERRLVQLVSTTAKDSSTIRWGYPRHERRAHSSHDENTSDPEATTVTEMIESESDVYSQCEDDFNDNSYVSQVIAGLNETMRRETGSRRRRREVVSMLLRDQLANDIPGMSHWVDTDEAEEQEEMDDEEDEEDEDDEDDEDDDDDDDEEEERYDIADLNDEESEDELHGISF